MIWSGIQNAVGIIAGGAAALMGVSFAVIIALQEKLLYVPTLPGTQREYNPEQPRSYGYRTPYFENLWLEASDGTKLHAWLLRTALRPSREAPTVLFFQENAGNIEHRLGFAQRLMVHAGNVNVMLLSYRGYGLSEGAPSEKGLVLDARAAIEHLGARADIGPRVFVFGRSLGGAVAIAAVSELADEKRADCISGIILENTFTCIADMVGKVMPVVSPLVGRGRPLHFLVRNTWDSDKRIARGLGGIPVLFIVGEKDELVPAQHMYKLFSLLPDDDEHCTRPSTATSPSASSAAGDSTRGGGGGTRGRRKTLVSITNGRHMDTWVVGMDRYWSAVRAFIS